MTQVKLLGELGQKFGSDWSSSSKRARDIFKLIDCQTEGFKEYLIDCHNKNIQFTIQNGEDFLDADDLVMPVLKDTGIITPVPAGSGKGLGKLIAGLLILGAMFFTAGTAAAFTTGGSMFAGTGMTAAQVLGGTSSAVAGGTITLNTLGSAVMMLGINLAVTGLTEMSTKDAGKMESDPSYFFNGAENNIEQGSPVPLLYGKMKIGGNPISQGYAPGRITNNRGYYYASNNINYNASTYYGNTNYTQAVWANDTNSDVNITESEK